MALRKKDTDMTQGTIWRLLLEFAVPMAIGLIFQQLYNTVDTIIVGRFVGKEALAAVGSTGSIINMLVGLCSGLATGASVVIAQSYGAKDNKRLSDAVHTTLGVALVLCVAATLVGLAITKPMLQAMDTPADVLDQSTTYLSIYFSGLTGLLLYNMGSGILRAVGDSRRPLYFLCFSAALNVIFDLLFVLAFDLGVAGVAYATILSQFLSALLCLWVLTRTKEAYGIRWKQLRVVPDTLREILRIGLPSGIQQALTSFSNVFVQSHINAFGSAAMAGWATYNKLDVFALVPMMAVATASTTFVGQNIGAGDFGRTRKGVKTSLTMAVGSTVTLISIMLLFAKPLLGIFTEDAEVLDFAWRFMRIVAPFYFCSCFNQICAGALRGAGNAKAPMYIMLGSFVLFRQAYLAVTKLLGSPFVMVALAYPMGWICCSILMFLAYRRSPICLKSGEA